MALTMKTTNISPYADPAVAMRRALPAVSFPCPGCRKPCDFRLVPSGSGISYDIDCSECGTTRVCPSCGGGKAPYVIDGTREPYDDRAELNAAKDRLNAVKGDAPEECLAMAEVAWETYLFMAPKALPVWEDAVKIFRSCDGIDKEHARRMVPWILRFCELDGVKELKDPCLGACRKAAKAIGAPETAEDCMLWLDLFDLECWAHNVTDETAPLLDVAKDAYSSLPEAEKARCPAFPVLLPLIRLDTSFSLWNPGYLDFDEDEIDDYEISCWDEALSEAEAMLRAGSPMTPRIFRMMSYRANMMSLSIGGEAVIGQLQELAGLSGEYADAFSARAELMEALMIAYESPTMPEFPDCSFDWTPEAVEKLEGAIEKLEGYSDPAISGELMMDAYYLLYTFDGSPDIMEYFGQLEEAINDRLVSIHPKEYRERSLIPELLGLGPRPAKKARKKADCSPKPKAKSKKERVAEKRKAHIAKRKSNV